MKCTVDLSYLIKIPLWIYSLYATWSTPVFWVVLLLGTGLLKATIDWKGR